MFPVLQILTRGALSPEERRLGLRRIVGDTQPRNRLCTSEVLPVPLMVSAEARAQARAPRLTPELTPTDTTKGVTEWTGLTLKPAFRPQYETPYYVMDAGKPGS